MAALTEAQVEMANSLTQDELPTKLRCAVCSKLAINAFRLPCCETAICETCQSTLPTSCPVCEHSPVSGDDCTVYKSLRTTIRVFLKTEEKKREASRPKLSDSAPQTPVEASTPTTAIQATSENVPNTTADEASARQPFEPSEELVPTKDAQLDEHNQVVAAGDAQEQEPEHDEHATQIDEEGSCNKQDSAQPAEHTSENGGNATGGDVDESFGAGDSTDDNQQSGTNYGPDNAGGNFNGIGYAGGDMSQMQMMMAMQNGMNPAAFGSFPMSGMDMNMNPMMMQNMFMNGGFGAQGMGMNGMNMNMGMNGFNGGGNDWNGQQSWNVGQDNFNPNAPGMGNGDFGNLNTGNYAGYGHHNQYNDYNRGGFGFRGRGRGRGRGFYGGYGRGYYNGYNNPQQNWAHQNPQYHNQGAQAVGSNGGQNAITGPENNDNQVTDQTGTATETRNSTQANGDGKATSADGLDSSQQQSSGPGRPDGMQSDASSVTVPDVPLNAPTGPKAMRQGLPNTSFHYLKARGLLPGENATGAAVGVSPIEDQTRSRSRSVHTYKNDDARHSDNGDRAHGSSDQGRSRRHDGRYDEPKSHPASRSPSRSRSRERKDSRRHRRHRSGSVSDRGDRDDGHHGPDEHRHRSHKSSRRSTKNEDDPKARSRDEPYDDKPRSVSPNDRDLGRDRDDHRERDKDRDHKRSSHRSRRDRDDRRRDRERDKDRTRDADDDRHRRPSHRSSRRDRDYERGDRDKDRDDRRHERRDRDRDRDSRRSSKAATSTPLTPIEAPEFNPPAGPKRHTSIFNIKGGASGSGGDLNHKRSSATGTGSSAQAPSSSSAAKDSHTLEREARDRERLLKEAQRLARGFGGAGSKRGRDDKDDRDGGSRRKSRRSEAVNDDEGESRMRRLEAERERDRYE